MKTNTHITALAEQYLIYYCSIWWKLEPLDILPYWWVSVIRMLTNLEELFGTLFDIGKIISLSTMLLSNKHIYQSLVRFHLWEMILKMVYISGMGCMGENGSKVQCWLKGSWWTMQGGWSLTGPGEMFSWNILWEWVCKYVSMY